MRFVLSSSVAAVIFMCTIALGIEPGPGGGKMLDDGSKMDGKMESAGAFHKAGQVENPAHELVEEVRPLREVSSIAAALDQKVDSTLVTAHIPASPEADDAEFFRRVTLDIIGRVPTSEEAVAFLASNDSEKRAHLIDALLASPSYGEHFATIWRELIAPRDNGVKGGRDVFSPWLAEQFNRNRGWDHIVTDMLVVEGKIRDLPQSGFIMANSDNLEPQPNLLADATARLFLGVQLRCAECHDHPFAKWKQADFWGIAAFFSRLRKGYSDGKNPNGWTLTEVPPDEPVSQQFTKVWAAQDVVGPAIVVQTAAGQVGGKVVRAKFLEGNEAGWTDGGPFRERFAQWATSGRNPRFAVNAVNRLWAHFFTRGLVTPLDGLNGDYQASHPEVLALLSGELVNSQFDIKHLIRCICNSRAYQRTSRTVAGNERDEKCFSHRRVTLMRPEELYDSVSVVLQPPGRKGGAKSTSFERAQLLPGLPREEFVRFFTSRADENEGSKVNQGIPQFLRLMNGPLLNATGMVSRRFAKLSDGSNETLDTVYLAAYARRPTKEERRLVEQVLVAPNEERVNTDSLLWTLLNSAEFVTNH
jgi:hypothetical protein